MQRSSFPPLSQPRDFGWLRPSVPTVVTTSPPIAEAMIGSAAWTQSPEIFVLEAPSTVGCAEKFTREAIALPSASRPWRTRTSVSMSWLAAS